MSKNSRSDLALAGAVLLAAFLFHFVAFRYYDDHFTVLSGARQVLAGDRPALDFFDQGRRLPIYLSAVLLWLSGGSLIGETQTCSLTRSMTTRPRFVGLNRCRPLTRHRNLLAMVTTAAATTSLGRSVRSSRQSDNPEIRALRESNRGKVQRREHA